MSYQSGALAIIFDSADDFIPALEFLKNFFCRSTSRQACQAMKSAIHTVVFMLTN